MSSDIITVVQNVGKMLREHDTTNTSYSNGYVSEIAWILEDISSTPRYMVETLHRMEKLAKTPQTHPAIIAEQMKKVDEGRAAARQELKALFEDLFPEEVEYYFYEE